jgi:hypothetical protein
MRKAKIIDPAPPPAAHLQLVTIPEVLKKLRLSRTGFRTARDEGKLRATWIGGRARFTEEDLLAFIELSREPKKIKARTLKTA